MPVSVTLAPTVPVLSDLDQISIGSISALAGRLFLSTDECSQTDGMASWVLKPVTIGSPVIHPTTPNYLERGHAMT